MSATFLNVDLDIESSAKPNCIEKELSLEYVSNLFSGEIGAQYISSFELHVTEENNNPNWLISEFCSLISQLSDEAKNEWMRVSKRIFDIGFEATSSKQRIDSELKVETVKAVADIGASINITIYPTYDENQAVVDNFVRA